MSLTVEITVTDDAWAVMGEPGPLVEAAALAALNEAGLEPQEAELSCLLCDDEAIRALNRQWRGQDKATNVLSFPAAGPGGGPMLGDLAIAFGTTAREAEEEGKTLRDHFVHLVVHGTLHLVGHDHETAAEAEAMEALEIRALARLGVKDPYAGSVPVEEEGGP